MVKGWKDDVVFDKVPSFASMATSAEDFMRRSIEGTPTALACNDLAELLLREKKVDKAKAFAQQAVSLDPQLPNARATLAAILANSQQEESR